MSTSFIADAEFARVHGLSLEQAAAEKERIAAHGEQLAAVVEDSAPAAEAKDVKAKDVKTKDVKASQAETK